MKKLPEVFKKSGFTFQQIERSDLVAIYKKTLNGRAVAFEVIKILVAPRVERWGKLFEEREVYPGTNSFGLLAWSVIVLDDEVKSLKKVQERYKKLNQVKDETNSNH